MDEEKLFKILRELAQETIKQLKNIDSMTPSEMAEITAQHCRDGVHKIKEVEAETYGQ